MESYGYPYQFPQMRSDEFPDHGDGVEYYGMRPLDGHEAKRRSRSKTRRSKRSRTRSISDSRSRTHSRSKSQSRSQSISRDRSRSHSGSRKESLKQPSLLDAFRVLYLKPSKHKKNTTKYLATKKKQDRIQEILKSDGLGSKKWLLYPRRRTESVIEPVSINCDKRVKVDADFFRKYKKRKQVDSDAPIAKLKRWELIFYKKLGFIQAV